MAILADILHIRVWGIAPVAALVSLFIIAPLIDAATFPSPFTTVGPGAGSASVNVTLGPASSVPSSSAAWLTVNRSAITGSTSLTFSYTANTSPKARTAAISLNGVSFAVWQMGAGGTYNQWVNGAYQQIWTIAGVGPGNPNTLGDGGPAALANFEPFGTDLDSNGNLYVTDPYHGRVRRIDASTGIVSTIAGTIADYFSSGDGGPATSAPFIFRLTRSWTAAEIC